jgi:citrate lyase subunit beta/citryl-CoA lyase
MRNKVKQKRLRRVMLAVSGADKNRIEKAVASRADEVFCDLEDSVPPEANQKSRARQTIATALNQLEWKHKTRSVRINALETPYWQEDVETLLKTSGDNLDCLIVPKVHSPKEIKKIEKLLSKLEKKLNLKSSIGLACLIETIEGIENSALLAQSSPRIEALIFGAGDFAAQMGMRLDIPHQGDPLYYPRFKLVAAARLAGIDAIDSPFFDFQDEAGYTRACDHAAALGFDGKMIIHPAQIEIGLKAFTPAIEAIDKARKITAAYKKAQQEGIGSIAFQGEMIDVATAKIYQNLIDKAELCGL